MVVAEIMRFTHTRTGGAPRLERLRLRVAGVAALCLLAPPIAALAGEPHSTADPSRSASGTSPETTDAQGESATDATIEAATGPADRAATGPASGSDLDAAPRPDRASGVVREERTGARPVLLWVPRALLFVPRVALEVADAPVRGALWAYKRYQLKDLTRETFFSEDGTVGLYPLAFFETGFGLNAGARFLHRDLLGAREKMRVRASFGGRYRQMYSLGIDSGDRFGARFVLELDAVLELRPKERFYGVGNLDTEAADPVPVPVDPREAALSSRFQEDLGRIALAGSLRLSDSLSARATGAYLYARFRGGDDDGAVSPEQAIDTFYSGA